MFEILLIVIFIWATGNQEIEAKSTWFNAMQKCRDQCTTIESNTTILKERYLKMNERFWIPKAVYKTNWIEQLGCYAFISMTNAMQYQDTLGGCQDTCLSINATYFSHKNKSCVCLPNFTLESSTQRSPCQYVVYRTITDPKFSGSGDCSWTRCKYAEHGYVRDGVFVTECKMSYNINTICSNGKYVGNYISQRNGMETCIQQNSHLPGLTGDSCRSINQNSQGRATSMMWSSIFRIEFTKTHNYADQLHKDPLSCRSGRYLNESKHIVEQNVPCETALSYICQKSGNKTYRISESAKCLPVKPTRDDTSTHKIAGIAAGVTAGTILVISILVIFIVFSRQRLDNKHGRHRNLCSFPYKRNESTDRKSADQHQHRNITAGQVNDAEVHHVRGTINNDEYAVIHKNTISRSDLSENTNSHGESSENTISHGDSSDFNDFGLVYTIPSSDYDRLSHCASRQTQLNSSLYDRTNVTSNGYNTAMHHVRKTSLLDEYDHVPSKGYDTVRSEYETPFTKPKEYNC